MDNLKEQFEMDATLNEGYYTVPAAAEKLGVGKRTIYNYIAGKQIQAVKIGKEYRIPTRAMADFMSRGIEDNYLKNIKRKPRKETDATKPKGE